MKSFTFSSGCPPSPLMLSFVLLECLHFLVLLASFFLAPNPRMSISTSTVFLHTSHPSPTYPFWSSHSLFLLGSCHRLSSQLTNELNHGSHFPVMNEDWLGRPPSRTLGTYCRQAGSAATADFHSLTQCPAPPPPPAPPLPPPAPPPPPPLQECLTHGARGDAWTGGTIGNQETIRDGYFMSVPVITVLILSLFKCLDV